MCILPFEAQIKHAARTIERNHAIKAEVTFCVRGVSSPLWSNIFLTPFDHAMTAAGYRVTRWADDFVVVCRTRQEAQAARALAESFLRDELGVSLHPDKTRIVDVDHGFEFLGYKVKRGKGLRLSASKRTSQTNPYNLYAVPREKSVTRFKDQIRNLTQRRAPVTLRHMIEVINPIIRGWGNYYRKANVRKLFHRLDGWIERRLWSFISKRWRNTAWRRYPSSCCQRRRENASTGRSKTASRMDAKCPHGRAFAARQTG